MIGGFKATLHSWYLLRLSQQHAKHLTTLTDPNSGDEAKQRAKAKLEELGVEVKE